MSPEQCNLRASTKKRKKETPNPDTDAGFSSGSKIYLAYIKSQMQ